MKNMRPTLTLVLGATSTHGWMHSHREAREVGIGEDEFRLFGGPIQKPHLNTPRRPGPRTL